MDTAPPRDDRPMDAAQCNKSMDENSVAEEQKSYGQILKSSALIGSSSILNIFVGIIRTKAMAALLGPGGLGLMSLYGSISDLAQSVAGMGINSSGVRQIAEAVGSGDKERIAQTAIVLRRITLLLGIFGAALLIIFARQVSDYTFGNDQNSVAVSVLAAAVFFRIVADGQGALIQGMRRIGDLAKIGVFGAFFGAIFSIILVYFLGEDGIVPSLVAIAGTSLAMSWWYSRKISIASPLMTSSAFQREAAALLKLGFAFMASGLMMMGATYLIRIMVLRSIGVEAAGLYQSAWALGGMYVGLVLQAMGADFYPRLTAVAKDNVACNRMVNEQAHVSLLLGVPGVIATLTLAPLVIWLFYTERFTGAVDVLRWLCLGMTLRIISWPTGFIIVAKGAQKFFFWSEAIWTAAYLGLAWIVVGRFGLNGTGIAFFLSYILHCFLTYAISQRLSGFRWSSYNRKSSFLLVLIAVVFCGFYILPVWPATGIGVGAIVLSTIYSIQVLLNSVSSDQVPRALLRTFWQLRLIPTPERKLNQVPAGGGAVEAAGLIKSMTIAFILASILCMWGYWYQSAYGWEFALKHCLPRHFY